MARLASREKTATPMPATTRGAAGPRKPLLGAKAAYVLGVDGCRGGWVAVGRALSNGRARVSVWHRFDALLAEIGANAGAIMVDMPIGLADFGKRGCEAMARQRLSPHRTSSVFPSPARPMLDFADYAAANAWGKSTGHGGLSKQAWMIAPKIREIDALIMPQHQAVLSEAHPEVAFARLNNDTPCRHPKKTEAGKAERIALLAAHGMRSAPALVEKARRAARALDRVSLADDDVIDACVLALTAKARLQGNAIQLTDGARDARGLLMEIWG